MVKFEDHMRLAEMIAKKIHFIFRNHYELEDLIQDAYVGLMMAIKKFDDSKGYKFSTYAYPIINGVVRNKIRDDRYRLGTRKSRLNASYTPILYYESGANDKNSDDKKTTFLEIMGKRDNAFDEVDFRIDLESAIKAEKERKVIALKQEGYTQKEIGNILGVEQAEISRKLKHVNKRLKEVI